MLTHFPFPVKLQKNVKISDKLNSSFELENPHIKLKLSMLNELKLKRQEKLKVKKTAQQLKMCKSRVL